MPSLLDLLIIRYYHYYYFSQKVTVSLAIMNNHGLITNKWNFCNIEIAGTTAIIAIPFC